MAEVRVSDIGDYRKVLKPLFHSVLMIKPTGSVKGPAVSI
jgi:hypothetical protein